MAITTTFLEQGQQKPADIAALMADFLSGAKTRLHLAIYGVYDKTQMDGVLAQWKGQPSEWKIAAFQQVAAPLSGKRSTPYTPGGSTISFLKKRVNATCFDIWRV